MWMSSKNFFCLKWHPINCWNWSNGKKEEKKPPLYSNSFFPSLLLRSYLKYADVEQKYKWSDDKYEGKHSLINKSRLSSTCHKLFIFLHYWTHSVCTGMLCVLFYSTNVLHDCSITIFRSYDVADNWKAMTKKKMNKCIQSLSKNWLNDEHCCSATGQFNLLNGIRWKCTNWTILLLQRQRVGKKIRNN